MAHEHYMQMCIALAEQGRGRTRSNPMVGSVIVHNDTVIGRGFHERYGDAHAEVNAINSLADKELLSESTLYVSLEPCSHYGKTPPCADLIIASKIPHVVIGCKDPNVLVAGKGIEKLRAAGVSVEFGVLEKECRNLNKHFITFHEKKRPYVLLKWAESIDGFIAPEQGKRYMLSNEQSLNFVHQLRSEHMAILVGSTTAATDNPQLNTRLVDGESPAKVLIDPELSIAASAQIFQGDKDVYVFNKSVSKKEKNTTFIRIDFSDPRKVPGLILNYLHAANINSLMVEGGKFTHEQFLLSGNFDEIAICKTTKILGSGIGKPELCLSDKRLERKSELKFDEDVWEFLAAED